MSKTMQALVLKSPNEVVVETRPAPQIQDPSDVIVKVSLAALCGSDMHAYHGHYHLPRHDFVMGHEGVGRITEVGSGVKLFKVGDRIVSPFTICCGKCFYCAQGATSRCEHNKLFGSLALDGFQAEYCRVPLADSTLFPAPDDIPPESLLLMADIFVTGYHVARSAAHTLGLENAKKGVAVVCGAGPVGLCAITAATHFFSQVYAYDPVSERLAQAAKHGAELIHSPEEADKIVKAATEGRGADAVLEVVGAQSALDLAVQITRPWGVISCVGIHTFPIQLDGQVLYNKNLRLQFGRCPVRALFPEALELLRQHADIFKSFISHDVPLSEAPKYYKLFSQRKVMKTVFRFPDA